MKYTYVTDYSKNDALRRSLNELTEKIFCFNFEEWYNNGFWGEKFIPHSLFDGEKVIAHVSVNLMDFNMDGTKKHYIQLGTVMTDKEYRGQGLSRYLIERIIAEYKDKVDGIYLFGNDRVINFYPRFGFTSSIEYECSKRVNITNDNIKLELINMGDKTSRLRFLETLKNSVSNEIFSMDNFGLAAFWTTGPMSNQVYYYADEDAYIVADIKKEEVFIHQIISANKVDLEEVIRLFDSSIKKVTLGFTPYDAGGYDIKELHEEDCTFFYLGKDLENIEKKRLMFPRLSHA